MARYRVTEQAKDDAAEIWCYIALDNTDAANRLRNQLLDKFQKLATHPRLGRIRDEFGPGIRSVSHGNYLIFYRLIDDGIEVIRVVHGMRDYPKLFDEQ